MARRVRRRKAGRGMHTDTVRRSVLYGVVLLLLAVLQCSFFARLQWLPATPDLMLGALLAILLLDSPQAATFAALGGGFLLDALGGVGTSWSPLFYWLTVVTVGLLSVKMMKNFRAWLVLMVPALLFRAGFDALGLWLSAGSAAVRSALRSVLLPQVCLTAVTAIPIYWLIRWCVCAVGARKGTVAVRRNGTRL